MKCFKILYFTFILSTLNCKPQNKSENQVLTSAPFKPEVKSIEINFFKAQNIEIPVTNGDSVDPVLALKTLFPGRFYQDYHGSKNENAVLWVCDSCPQIQIPGFEEDGNEIRQTTFPDTTLNYTVACGSLVYRIKRTTYCAIFFSTTYNGELPFTGRTAPGVLGISTWEKKENYWLLRSFAPGVVREGTFQTAHAPQNTTTIGPEQAAFVLKGGYANAAGVGHLYHGLFLFGNVKGALRLLLFDYDAFCDVIDSRLTHWDTQIEPVDSNMPYSDLLLITKGHYDASDDDYEYGKQYNPWWKKMEHFIQKADKSNFTLIRRYRFDGNQYKLMHSSFEKQ
jgi:hypothetical protein